MPLTFTAPIEEIPGLIPLTLSSDRKSAPWIVEDAGRGKGDSLVCQL
jgi:hypothetical protein